MAMIAQTPTDLLRDSLRAGGLPVAVLKVDGWYYELSHEPDRTEHDYFSSVGRETWRKRDFTAPLFQWAFDDGRRFQGRPTVALHKRKAEGLLWSSETWHLDEPSMVREIGKMIQRSFVRGAEEE